MIDTHAIRSMYYYITNERYKMSFHQLFSIVSTARVFTASTTDTASKRHFIIQMIHCENKNAIIDEIGMEIRINRITDVHQNCMYFASRLLLLLLS